METYVTHMYYIVKNKSKQEEADMEHVIAFRLAKIIDLLQILIIIFVIYIILYSLRWAKETYPSFRIFPRRNAAYGRDRKNSETEARTVNQDVIEKEEENK